MKNTYTYLSTQRPIAPGTFPKKRGNPIDIVNFDTRREHYGNVAWGFLTYAYELTEQEIDNHELHPMQ